MPGELLENLSEDVAHAIEGDFGRAITLFFQGETIIRFGKVDRITAMTDPQTNLQVALPRHTVTLMQSSLGTRKISEGMRVSVSLETFRVVDPKPDYSLGTVTFQLAKIDDTQPEYNKVYAG